MDCRRRWAVDDDRSRRKWAVDEDRRRIRWAIDDDRRRRRWAVHEDQCRRRWAIDDDRRRRRWEVDHYPPLQLPLQWRDPPPQYPPLEVPLKWRNPLPEYLVRNQPATVVYDSPPLRSHSVAHDSASASSSDQDCNPASLRDHTCDPILQDFAAATPPSPLTPKLAVPTSASLTFSHCRKVTDLELDINQIRDPQQFQYNLPLLHQHSTNDSMPAVEQSHAKSSPIIAEVSDSAFDSSRDQTSTHMRPTFYAPDHVSGVSCDPTQLLPSSVLPALHTIGSSPPVPLSAPVSDASRNLTTDLVLTCNLSLHSLNSTPPSDAYSAAQQENEKVITSLTRSNSNSASQREIALQFRSSFASADQQSSSTGKKTVIPSISPMHYKYASSPATPWSRHSPRCAKGILTEEKLEEFLADVDEEDPSPSNIQITASESIENREDSMIKPSKSIAELTEFSSWMGGGHDDNARMALEEGPYHVWPEEKRQESHLSKLSEKHSLLGLDLHETEEITDVIEKFQVITKFPSDSFGAYSISMITAISDVLAVELLQKKFHVKKLLRIVSQFEKLADFEAASTVIAWLFSKDWHRNLINGKQEVMIRYSDSRKNARHIPVAWQLYKAQEELVKIAKEYGAKLSKFHDRGGIAGTGGPIHLAILSPPPDTIQESIYQMGGAYPILDLNGKSCKPEATLKLSIQYIPIEKQGMNYRGVGAGPNYEGVPCTYFQDAHELDGCLLDLKLDQHCENEICWRDMSKAVRQARHLTCMAGWSMFHTVHDVGLGTDCMLGDLLKSKSLEERYANFGRCKIFDPGGLLMFPTTISLPMLRLNGVELFCARGE